MPSNDVYRLECCQLAVQIWSRQWKQIESGTLKIEVQIELPSDTWESPNIGQHSVDLIIRMPTNQDSLNESFELNGWVKWRFSATGQYSGLSACWFRRSSRYLKFRFISNHTESNQIAVLKLDWISLNFTELFSESRSVKFDSFPIQRGRLGKCVAWRTAWRVRYRSVATDCCLANRA